MTFHLQKKLKYIQLVQKTYVYFSTSLPIFGSLVLSNL